MTPSEIAKEARDIVGLDKSLKLEELNPNAVLMTIYPVGMEHLLDKITTALLARDEEIERIKQDRVEISGVRYAWKDGYYKLQSELAALKEENARLDHLHKLDHSLADQRQQKLDAALSDAAALKDLLVKSVETTIREYKLSYTKIDDGESGYPLIDALTPPGAPTIEFGKEEMDMLVDEVLGVIEEQFAAYRQRGVSG